MIHWGEEEGDMSQDPPPSERDLLERIAEALERMAPVSVSSEETNFFPSVPLTVAELSRHAPAEKARAMPPAVLEGRLGMLEFEVAELRKRVVHGWGASLTPGADQRCTWPRCANAALCRSGNFGDQPVCADHFAITNGPANTQEAVDAFKTAYWRENPR